MNSRKKLREEFGFKLNNNETNIMESSINKSRNSLNIKVGSDEIQNMNDFNHLDSIITKDDKVKMTSQGDWSKTKEVKTRRKISFYQILD